MPFLLLMTIPRRVLFMIKKEKRHIPIREYVMILIGSILYAFSTVVFIFPNAILLGGTSGISVILTDFLPFSPGAILMIINFVLILLAFLILGKEMAQKTLIGSILTTVFIGGFERLFPSGEVLALGTYISAVIGAFIIAIASGIMFYVDSSSGGTDIIALIVKKFSGIPIGRALLITDILIVAVGGFLSGIPILIGSSLGFLIKTLGIDAVIWLIKRRTNKPSEGV